MCESPHLSLFPHLPVAQLLPPSFTLLATSNTLSVRVHPKPVLRELFPYGVTYTIYLDEQGKENQVGIEIGDFV